MAVGHPDTCVILMLFRSDLRSECADKPIEEIEWSDIRWTCKDSEYADRVDFIDIDGDQRTLKVRPLQDGVKVQSIARPEVFDFFDLYKQMPWVTGPYLRFRHEPNPR